MWLGDNIVAYAWSFNDPGNEIPYRISLTGSSKAEGGNGIRWSCTCPSYIRRGRKMCKHISILKDEAKSGVVLADKRFELSDLGKKIFNL